METITEFCNLIKTRTSENREAVNLLTNENLYGQVMSVLRQELDSLVRCIFLLETDLIQREKLMIQTLKGERWMNDQNKTITDREMVNITNLILGWTKSVYDLGCAFIHLSTFHNYAEKNPFDSISETDKNNIKRHLNNYHGYDMSQELTFKSVSPYLKSVFDKVSSNLDCYIERLEKNELKAD